MKKKIVIIGACAAGPKVAMKSRRMDKDSEITIFASSNYMSYSACGLPYFVGGVIPNINSLIVKTPKDFIQKNINVHLNTTVTKILPDKKEIIVNNENVPYDELVIATGSYPHLPKFCKKNLKNVFTIKHIEDGINIKQIAEVSKSVIILGFACIAFEMLEAFLNNNLKVYIVERLDNPMCFIDKEFGELVKKYIKDKYNDKVTIITGNCSEDFIGDDKFEGVILNSGDKIYADFCLIATGVLPNSELFLNMGGKSGLFNSIPVDKKMHTEFDHIWSVGDCTEKYCYLTGAPVYYALGSIANKQGRVCAINLNGGDEDFLGVLGSTITKFYDLTVAKTGINETWYNNNKTKVDIDPIYSTVTKLDKASYMKGTLPITIKLMADKKSKRILGAEGFGLGEVDKRINIVSSAIQKMMTIDEFLNMDLSYAPTTSATIDPLLTAGYELKKQI